MQLDITPDPGFFAAFPHLNYKAWYAVAEFVDNSIQSFEENKAALREINAPDYKLKIRISTNDGRSLRITDNAAGIRLSEFPRAFRVAAIPANRQGLSEFGMGMKTAACWFSPLWEVRTSALGDPCERTVIFNIPGIIENSIRNLDVTERLQKSDAHYTEVTLKNLYHPPFGSTKAKIKQHLACMYRKFLEKGEVEIYFDEELLEYQLPHILNAPYFKDPTGNSLVWRKELDFTFETSESEIIRATGFLAIRERMTTKEAGLSLFRRNRLIIGSVDDLYRPSAFLGAANEAAARRIFGDIELDPVKVTHTKDGIVNWSAIEESFLKKLREEADSGDIKLRSQAANFRNLPAPVDDREPESYDPVTEVVLPIAVKAAKAISGSDTEQTLTKFGAGSDQVLLEEDAEPVVSSRFQQVTQKSTVKFDNVEWRITVEFSGDEAMADWVQIFNFPSKDKNREIGIRLAMGHPFTLGFSGPNFEYLESQVRMAIALCLAECAARDAGVNNAGKVRDCINELLRGKIGEPAELGGEEGA
jgi:hypothetical protein